MYLVLSIVVWQKYPIYYSYILYTSIEFLNKKPIAFNYKGKKILGDKISISISDDKTAQELSYMALGTGILQMNARGAGYMNYKWLAREKVIFWNIMK